MPDPVALQLVVAVADHGSVSAAARWAGMSQPAASRSLSRLERRLGITLLTRATTGSRLTGAGLSVVDWARDVIAAYDRLSAGVSLLGAGAAPLGVASSQTIAEHLLPGWLAELRIRQPEVSVQVSVANSTEVIQQLISGGCDLAFVEGPIPPPGVHSAIVCRDELVLVVAAAHPWARRTMQVSAEELAWTPRVVREQGSGTRVALDQAFAKRGLTMAEPALVTTSNAAVRVAVAAGLAPAVLSRLAVADALASGSLVEVDCMLRLRRSLRVAWTGPRQLTGAAADLVRVASARPRGNR